MALASPPPDLEFLHLPAQDRVSDPLQGHLPKAPRTSLPILAPRPNAAALFALAGTKDILSDAEGCGPRRLPSHGVPHATATKQRKRSSPLALVHPVSPVAPNRTRRSSTNNGLLGDSWRSAFPGVSSSLGNSGQNSAASGSSLLRGPGMGPTLLDGSHGPGVTAASSFEGIPAGGRRALKLVRVSIRAQDIAPGELVLADPSVPAFTMDAAIQRFLAEGAGSEPVAAVELGNARSADALAAARAPAPFMPQPSRPSHSLRGKALVCSAVQCRANYLFLRA